LDHLLVLATSQAAKVNVRSAVRQQLENRVTDPGDKLIERIEKKANEPNTGLANGIAIRAVLPQISAHFKLKPASKFRIMQTSLEEKMKLWEKIMAFQEGDMYRSVSPFLPFGRSPMILGCER
jgi:hypothetical protein